MSQEVVGAIVGGLFTIAATFFAWILESRRVSSSSTAIPSRADTQMRPITESPLLLWIPIASVINYVWHKEILDLVAFWPSDYGPNVWNFLATMAFGGLITWFMGARYRLHSILRCLAAGAITSGINEVAYMYIWGNYIGNSASEIEAETMIAVSLGLLGAVSALVWWLFARK